MERKAWLRAGGAVPRVVLRELVSDIMMFFVGGFGELDALVNPEPLIGWWKFVSCPSRTSLFASRFLCDTCLENKLHAC